MAVVRSARRQRFGRRAPYECLAADRDLARDGAWSAGGIGIDVGL